jgi:hypothetical protein
MGMFTQSHKGCVEFGSGSEGTSTENDSEEMLY